MRIHLANSGAHLGVDGSRVFLISRALGNTLLVGREVVIGAGVLIPGTSTLVRESMSQIRRTTEFIRAEQAHRE